MDNVSARKLCAGMPYPISIIVLFKIQVLILYKCAVEELVNNAVLIKMSYLISRNQATMLNILLLVALLPKPALSRAVMDLATSEVPLQNQSDLRFQSPQLISEGDRAPTPSKSSSEAMQVGSENYLPTTSQKINTPNQKLSTALMTIPETSLSKRGPQMMDVNEAIHFGATLGLIVIWKSYQIAIPSPIKDSINQVVIPLRQMYSAIVDAATTQWTKLQEATAIRFRYGRMYISITPLTPNMSIPWEFVADFARHAMVWICVRMVGTFEGFAYWMGTYAVFIVSAVITPPKNETGGALYT